MEKEDKEEERLDETVSVKPQDSAESISLRLPKHWRKTLSKFYDSPVLFIDKKWNALEGGWIIDVRLPWQKPTIYAGEFAICPHCNKEFPFDMKEQKKMREAKEQERGGSRVRSR